jgi:hypothetical protein
MDADSRGGGLQTAVQSASMRIPHHVRQPSAVRHILPKGSLLEAIDHDYRNDVETHC